MKKGKIILYAAICAASFGAGMLGTQLTKHQCVSEDIVMTSKADEDKSDKFDAVNPDVTDDSESSPLPDDTDNAKSDVMQDLSETEQSGETQNDTSGVQPESSAAAVQNENTSGLVNINTADAATLMTLYGIGEKISQRIIDYREANGPFEVIEDIMKVSGIGEKKFANIKDKICVD